MTVREIVERPRAVGVIGWTSLLLSVVLSAKALIDIAVWKVMGPAMPTLMGMASERPPAPPFLRSVLAHLTEIKLAQAALWVVIGATAVALLRLRPWARVAMQAAGWLVLVYFAGVLCVWAVAWSKAGGDPTAPRLSDSSRMGVLVGGVSIGAVLAAFIVAMIGNLSRPEVRRAFDVSGDRAAGAAASR
jgi:hypothetical protein